MALEARLRELATRHHALDTAIEREMKRPALDDLRILEMKKQKLRLKDELAALGGARA